MPSPPVEGDRGSVSASLLGRKLKKRCLTKQRKGELMLEPRWFRAWALEMRGPGFNLCPPIPSPLTD
jgi:hypothetical protein